MYTSASCEVEGAGSSASSSCTAPSICNCLSGRHPGGSLAAVQGHILHPPSYSSLFVIALQYTWQVSSLASSSGGPPFICGKKCMHLCNEGYSDTCSIIGIKEETLVCCRTLPASIRNWVWVLFPPSPTSKAAFLRTRQICLVLRTSLGSSLCIQSARDYGISSSATTSMKGKSSKQASQGQ